MGKTMGKSNVNGENMGKHEKIWRNNVGKYGETWEDMGKPEKHMEKNLGRDGKNMLTLTDFHTSALGGYTAGNSWEMLGIEFHQTFEMNTEQHNTFET